MSSVMDITTRDGNKRRVSGLVGATTFGAKALIEGPIKKQTDDGYGSSSFVFSAKHSYLDQSSKLLYDYIDEDGLETPWEAPTEPRQVISKEAADEMLKLMEGVVQEGTAQAAKIDGYRVGGKTGTGQAAGASGYDGHTTSFTGVVPLDDPQFVVSVAVHRPQGDWKTWQVTDTAADVMKYLLSKYSVPPSETGPQHYDVFTEDPQERPW